MRVGVLGTGVVGQGQASKLVSLGHEVMMGSRTAGNEKAVAWVAGAAGAGAVGNAREGTFADAAAFGEMIVNATNGEGSIEALTMAGADNLAGKVLVDISNPLDHSGGFPPRLFVCNTDSLGEQIQRAFPEARVVKTMNTVNINIQVDPSVIPTRHTMFLCGNDDAAKADVRQLLLTYGWPDEDLLDLGDITGARAMEMNIAMWLRVATTTNNWGINIKVVP
jgi:predicted dinucleotide-binding enzyme